MVGSKVGGTPRWQRRSLLEEPPAYGISRGGQRRANHVTWNRLIHRSQDETCPRLETITVPGTGLKPSRIALGTWAIGRFVWGRTDEAESIRTITAP
jgi:hypothetical protein